MKAVEEYAGEGQLIMTGESRPVGYHLTRLQGMAANGLPVPGLFRIEGEIDLRGTRLSAKIVPTPFYKRRTQG